jgi:hypothetical protein
MRSSRSNHTWRLNATTAALALILIFVLASFYSSHTLHTSVGNSADQISTSKASLIRTSMKNNNAGSPISNDATVAAKASDIESWFDKVISRAHSTLEKLEKADLSKIVIPRQESSTQSATNQALPLETEMRQSKVFQGKDPLETSVESSHSSTSSTSSVKIHAVTYASHGGRFVYLSFYSFLYRRWPRSASSFTSTNPMCLIETTASAALWSRLSVITLI